MLLTPDEVAGCMVVERAISRTVLLMASEFKEVERSMVSLT